MSTSVILCRLIWISGAVTPPTTNEKRAQVAKELKLLKNVLVPFPLGTSSHHSTLATDKDDQVPVTTGTYELWKLQA